MCDSFVEGAAGYRLLMSIPTTDPEDPDTIEPDVVPSLDPEPGDVPTHDEPPETEPRIPE